MPSYEVVCAKRPPTGTTIHALGIAVTPGALPVITDAAQVIAAIEGGVYELYVGAGDTPRANVVVVRPPGERPILTTDPKLTTLNSLLLIPRCPEARR